MTVHSVTKEELEQIWRDCVQVKGFSCEECKHCISDTTSFTCTDGLRENILSRPDPLALLESWIDSMHTLDDNGETFRMRMADVHYITDAIRTNPEAVRQQGVKEGWINDC
jgi:hypothetical protein